MDETIDSSQVGYVVGIIMFLLCAGPILIPIPIALIRRKGTGFIKVTRTQLFNSSDIESLAKTFAGIAMCLGAFLILLPKFNASMTAGLVLGYVMTFPVLAILTVIGLISAIRFPKEVSGARRVPAVFAILLVSILLASGIGWFRHGPTIRDFVVQEVDKQTEARRSFLEQQEGSEQEENLQD